MADVHLSVGEHQFSMRCEDEEKPVLELAGELLDAQWKVAQRAAGAAGPFRVMLLAALLMGKDLLMREAPVATPGADTGPDLSAIADRLEELAAALEDALPGA